MTPIIRFVRRRKKRRYWNNAPRVKPGKNAVSLFDAKQKHTYSWGAFAGQVMDEKLKALSAFFQGQDERGMAFLYQMTHLLRAA